jgi:tetratricopeptide (TPR) repeat protein
MEGMKLSSTEIGRHTSRRRGRGILPTVFIMMALVSAPLMAQEEETELLGDLETQETASMRESTYKELAKAQEAAEAENYSEAIRFLDKLSKDDLNDYERSQVLNLYAFIYYAQDQLDNAIGAYEELLTQADLPEALKKGTIYNLGQLYFSQENWRKGIEYLNLWLEVDQVPKPQTYEMIAQAYYQLGEYRNALEPTRRSIELTEKSGKPVKEQSYLLLRVLYYELEDYSQVANVLQELIRRFPKKQYWIQLASIYGEMGQERKQLNVLELLYLQGLLDSQTEVLTLVGLLLQNDLPYRAGKVLQKGLDDGVIESTLDHWRLLSQAWTLSQEDEKAIPALRKAAELSRGGEIDLVLAQTYMNLERWGDAAAAARVALRKGSLARTDQANILLGQALFNMEQFDEAQAAFQRALSDNRSRRIAGQWIGYIEREKDRLAQLQDALGE